MGRGKLLLDVELEGPVEGQGHTRIDDRAMMACLDLGVEELVSQLLQLALFARVERIVARTRMETRRR